MIRYVPRYSGVLRVGIRVIVELYIVGPRRLRVDELRLIMMRARRGMRAASVEVVLDQGSPRRGNSSKGGDSVYGPSKGEEEGKPSKGKLLEGRGLRLRSLEGGRGREALEGETPRREGTPLYGPSKGEEEVGSLEGVECCLVCAGFALRRAKQAAASQQAACAMERALIVVRASRDNGRDATYRMIDDQLL